MENTYLKIEELREALFNLERLRQQEKDQLNTAEAIVKCLEVISSFNNDSDEIFLKLNNNIERIIPFDDVYILKKNHKEKHCSILYGNKQVDKIQSVFLCTQLQFPRHIVELQGFHGLAPIVKLGGSALLVPFEVNEEEYVLIYANKRKAAFRKRHLKIAVEVSSIFKQAIVNHNLVSKLVYSDKMVSIAEFASGLAHEINNPLTVINAKNYNLSRKNEKGTVTFEDIEKCTQLTLKTVDRITKIINGLRNVSRRVENEDTFELVLLKDVFDDVISLCLEKFQRENIELNINLDNEIFLTEVYSERIQLSQVFLNLLNNAFDAAKSLPHAWVKVTVEVQGSNCLVRFIDCGSGIEEDKLNNIFKVFYTSKKIGEGTGG